MRQINTELYIKNLLSLIDAADSAGGKLNSWFLKPDVSELLICLANNNIKLNPVYIKPKDWDDIIEQSELLREI